MEKENKKLVMDCVNVIIDYPSMLLHALKNL